MMLTSVGGSVKLWRRPTITGPLAGNRERVEAVLASHGLGLAAADVEAEIDAARRRGVVDGAEIETSCPVHHTRPSAERSQLSVEIARPLRATVIQHQPRVGGRSP